MATGSFSCLLAGPVTLPTTLPRWSRATASTRAVADAPADSTVTARVLVSMSGVVTTLSMDVSATGSIQTVCQMPEDWVYQMPPGLVDCLPTGWSGPPVSVTATTISWGPLLLSASVMSALNAL